MSVQIWLGALLIVGGGGMLWWSVSGSARLQTTLVRRNLGPNSTVDLRSMDLARPARDRVLQPTMAGLVQRAGRLTPSGWSESLESRISLAGMSDQWPTDRVLAVKVLLGISGVLFALVLIASNPSGVSLVFGGFTIVFAWLLPESVLSRKARMRQAEIGRGLPDVLDQVTIAVEAGLGFEAALARAVRTGDGPLTDEFGRALSEIRAGVPREQAFTNMLDRTDVPDLRHFVLAVQQASRHGVPIARVLRTQAKELRDKRKQHAEEQAQKIGVKVIFPLILCILPALFIVILGPAVIRIGHAF